MMATVDEQRRRKIEGALLRNPDAAVEVSLCLWQQLAAALNQIVGERGVESIYARSLHQSQKQFSWLTVHAPQALEAAKAQLRSDLLGQPAELAAEASTVMLMHFTTTLSLLIGELLTNSILRQAWGDVAVNHAGTESNE